MSEKFQKVVRLEDEAKVSEQIIARAKAGFRSLTYKHGCEERVYEKALAKHFNAMKGYKAKRHEHEWAIIISW